MHVVRKASFLDLYAASVSKVEMQYKKCAKLLLLLALADLATA